MYSETPPTATKDSAKTPQQAVEVLRQTSVQKCFPQRQHRWDACTAPNGETTLEVDSLPPCYHIISVSLSHPLYFKEGKGTKLWITCAVLPTEPRGRSPDSSFNLHFIIDCSRNFKRKHSDDSHTSTKQTCQIFHSTS